MLPRVCTFFYFVVVALAPTPWRRLQFITVEDVGGVRPWHLTPKVLSVLRALTGTMKAHYVERYICTHTFGGVILLQSVARIQPEPSRDTLFVSLLFVQARPVVALSVGRSQGGRARESNNQPSWVFHSSTVCFAPCRFALLCRSRLDCRVLFLYPARSLPVRITPSRFPFDST